MTMARRGFIAGVSTTMLLASAITQADIGVAGTEGADLAQASTPSPFLCILDEIAFYPSSGVHAPDTTVVSNGRIFSVRSVRVIPGRGITMMRSLDKDEHGFDLLA